MEPTATKVRRSTRTAKRRVSKCSECPTMIEVMATGRPRVVCSRTCANKRRHRQAWELVSQDRAEADTWWELLSLAQREVARAWARLKPKPKFFEGGVVTWMFFNRGEFA